MIVAIRALTRTFNGVCRSTAFRSLAAISAVGGLQTTSSFADEELVNDAAGKLAEAAAKKSAEGQELMMKAIGGDTNAMLSLFNEFLLPLVVAAGVIFVGYMVAGIVGRKIGSFVSHKVDETLGRFAQKAVKTVVFLFVLMSVLSKFGINLTSVAALLAAAGFAVGMALSGTLGNFAAGIMLLLFRPFKVGDYVKMAGTEGAVEAIDLFTTQLNTTDNRRLIVPNGEVFGATIENVSHNPTRRVDVSVGCDYEACLDKTRATLESAIASVGNTVREPASKVVLVDLGDSAVNWQVRVWCKSEDYWTVRQDLTAATKKALDAADISIPYPQMDIHMTTVNPETDPESRNKPRRRDISITMDRMRA